MSFGKVAFYVALITLGVSIWVVFFSRSMVRHSKVIELRSETYDVIEKLLQLRYGDYYMWRPKIIVVDSQEGRSYVYSFVADFEEFDGSIVTVRDFSKRKYSFTIDNKHVVDEKAVFTYFVAPTGTGPKKKIEWEAEEMMYELDNPEKVSELFRGADMFVLVWVDDRPLSVMFEEIEVNGGDMAKAKISPTIHLVRQYD